MIFGSPVQGTIRPDARYYPNADNATLRPPGSNIPLVTQDFGPSSVGAEPTVAWPGGEADIYGNRIPAGTYANFHRAIDISQGGSGFPILAAAAGKVTAAGLVSGWGGAIIVLIDHGTIGGFRWDTGYVHLQSESVSVGQLVKAGDVIGKLGNTGVSTGAHLHWLVRKNGQYVNGWARLSQNTTVDPDAPEDDMPAITTYIPGHVATITNAAGDVNVRATPTLAGKVVRQVPQGTSEAWAVTGWVKGDATSGSDQWITRWNGAWEYVHKISVAAVIPPGGPAPKILPAGVYEVKA